jgi:hypothetical protein
LAVGLMADAFGLSFGLVSGLVFGLVAGPAFGLVVGLGIGLSSGQMAVGEPVRQPRRSWFRTAGWLVHRLRDERAMPNGDMRPSARNAWIAVPFGLTAGLAAGLIGGLVGGLAFGLYTALAIGLGCGLTSIVASALSDGLSDRIEPTEQMRWSWPKLRAGLSRAVLGGLVGALIIGPLFALAAGLTGMVSGWPMAWSLD